MKITESKLRSIIKSVVREAVEGESGGKTKYKLYVREGKANGSKRFLVIRSDNSALHDEGGQNVGTDKVVSDPTTLQNALGVKEDAAKKIYDVLQSASPDEYVDVVFHDNLRDIEPYCTVTLIPMNSRQIGGKGKRSLGDFKLPSKD